MSFALPRRKVLLKGIRLLQCEGDLVQLFFPACLCFHVYYLVVGLRWDKELSLKSKRKQNQTIKLHKQKNPTTLKGGLMSAASLAVVTGKSFHVLPLCFKRVLRPSIKSKPCGKLLSKVSCSLCLLQKDLCGSDLQRHQAPCVWGDVPGQLLPALGTV